MFGRVGTLLLAIALLFVASAPSALSLTPCDFDTAECLISLESQAEEVPRTDADLDVVSSFDHEAMVETCAHVSLVEILNCTDHKESIDCTVLPAFKASGAAGVHGSIADNLSNYLASMADTSATNPEIRTGRFSGATI